VREQAHKLPLSVSTDRIAYCAMRCAVILGDLAQHLEADLLARDGTGLVVEAYPDAALRCWLPTVWAKAREDSYKGAGEPARARRDRIAEALLAELGPAFAITAAQREACAPTTDLTPWSAHCLPAPRAAATPSRPRTPSIAALL
jgi:hypothetical protein